MGDEFIYTFACDTTNNVCPVAVPAPGAALVFLSDDALQNSVATTTQTFTATATSGVRNTATIDPTVLAVSNGRGGQNFMGLGSTSPGTVSSASVVKASLVMVSVSVLSALVVL